MVSSRPSSGGSSGRGAPSPAPPRPPPRTGAPHAAVPLAESQRGERPRRELADGQRVEDVRAASARRGRRRERLGHHPVDGLTRALPSPTSSPGELVGDGTQLVGDGEAPDSLLVIEARRSELTLGGRDAAELQGVGPHS